MNKIIQDYMGLTISAHEFVNKIFSDEQLYSELNSYMPTRETAKSERWSNFLYMLYFETHNYDLKLIVKNAFSMGANPSGRSTMYNFFYKVFEANGITLQYNTYYKDRVRLLMDAVPAYVGGAEADAYIDSFIDNLDPALNEAQKKKLIKEMVKKEFICEGKAKPKWVQEPEWLVVGKPMVFISQSTEGDKFVYVFRDVVSGEKRQVTQYA